MYPGFVGDQRTWWGTVAGLAAADAVGSTDGPAPLGTHQHLPWKGNVPTQDTEPTTCPNPPSRHPTPLTVPSRVLWGATVPIQRLQRASCPGVCHVPSHSHPTVGLGAPERSNLPGGAAGKRGCRDTGGGEWVLPASPCPVAVPGWAASRQPHGPAVLRRLRPWCAGAASASRALAPCPVTVSSRFLLFPPPPTPPRGTHGEEEAQFPIVSVFLFIVLLGKTQRPANKPPFIRRPQCRGVRRKCRRSAGLRQPLGFSPQRRDGAHCSRRHQGNG